MALTTQLQQEIKLAGYEFLKVVPVIAIGHGLKIIFFPVDDGIVLSQFGPHRNQAM